MILTVAVMDADLLPIMLGSGTGSEVTRRIAAPMVGGMITAPLQSTLVLPAAYLSLHRREVRKTSWPCAAMTEAVLQRGDYERREAVLATRYAAS